MSESGVEWSGYRALLGSTEVNFDVLILEAHVVSGSGVEWSGYGPARLYRNQF